MTTDTVQDLIQALDGAARALAPLVALGIGTIIVLLAEITPVLQRLRPHLFLATIAAGALSFLSLRGEAPGLVLDGTFNMDERCVDWGLLFLASTTLAWIFAQRYYRESRAFLGEHDVLLLCTPIGMTIMAGAEDLLVFFVGLELLSIPLYCLAAFRRTRNDSVEAGLKYFVLGAFAAATFLYGSALIYGATGTISLSELRAPEYAQPLGSSLALVGAALITASLLFKVGAAPFHLWVPDVYQGAPTPVTALMATGTKAAGFAFLFQASFLLPASSATLLVILAVVTLFLGNLGALVQNDLKRMLAYSSVAHAGTMLLLVAAGLAGPADPDRIVPAVFDREVLEAAIVYMVAYTFTAGGAFGLLSWLEADGERFTSIKSLRGLGVRRPGIAAGMTLFLLSLGGMPGTGGFLGKYFVFSAAVHSGFVLAAVLGALASVIALGYYLRVVVAMWMESAPEDEAPPVTRRISAGLAGGVCAAVVLVVGVMPQVLLTRVL